ncbi:TolB family protein [Psychrosphaera haliotis]|uniref:Peptidase MA-like domain-containing protein n=1 Tax=Psychrosphaera haliotis TaxID=555083 RepID=A0A6N8FBI7_9GAMM|nr:hypothetical protein [Psychrosphaera haliotis]MUH72527.1 hypothetical protein [Psychrosphaera haliotis]
MKSLISSVVLLASAAFSSFSPSANEILNPKLDWQVLETPNFKIHFTPNYKDWAYNAANEMEHAQNLIKQQQNRVLTEKVDVVVFDPLNNSNGFALAFSHKPFMALYATSALSETVISNSDSWPQLLALHEYVHLVHLGQQDRAKWRNTIRKYHDLYDAYASGLNRWVSEGYATLLESKLTGRGRLFDAQVEATILQYAREGALPKYSQLSATSGGYKAGSMAYLVGVRFLAWLEKEYSEQHLDAVWTRMRGEANRNFDNAFEGIFQQPASQLYNRFVAEYTQIAMNTEQQSNAAELWFDADFELRSPTFSPDQSKFLAVEASNDASPKYKLSVYETAINTKAIETFNNQNEAILNDDTQDIANNEPRVFNSKRIKALNSINGKGVSYPRWLNEEVVLYVASSTDNQGQQHQDLFKWDISTGKVTQLTTSLNIRRFDVSSDAEFIVAERNEFGKSSLIKLSLNSLGLASLGSNTSGLNSSDSNNLDLDSSSSNGSVHIQGKLASAIELKTPSIKESYDFPRLNPKNPEQLAYLSKSINGNWLVKLADLGSSNRDNTSSNISTSDKTIALPSDYQFLSYLNWTPDGESLLFVASQSNQLFAYQYDIKSGFLSQITNGEHPVAWPTVWKTEDKLRLVFASTRSTGPNLYVQPLQKTENTTFTTQIPKPQTERSKFTKNTDSKYLMPLAGTKHELANAPSVPYNSKAGLHDQNISLVLAGTNSTASSNLIEIGIKGADLMQRLSWMISVGSDEVLSGYSGYMSWKGWPVNVAVNAFSIEIDPSKQGDDILGTKINKDGFNIAADWSYGVYQGLFETYRGQLNTSLAYSSLDDVQFAVTQIDNTGNTIQNLMTNVGNNETSFQIGHKQTLSYDMQEIGVFQSSDITWLSGETEYTGGQKEKWTGHQGSFILGATWLDVSLIANHTWATRHDSDINLMSFGGLDSNILASHNLPNWVFIPELPFAVATGNDFTRNTISIGPKGGFQVYFSDLELDTKPSNANVFTQNAAREYTIYGVRGDITLELIGLGLTGIDIEFGLANVTEKLLSDDKEDTQAWISLKYNY